MEINESELLIGGILLLAGAALICDCSNRRRTIKLK